MPIPKQCKCGADKSTIQLYWYPNIRIFCGVCGKGQTSLICYGNAVELWNGICSIDAEKHDIRLWDGVS